MRIQNIELTVGAAKVNLTASYPQDSTTEPAAYFTPVTGIPRLGWPSLYALVRPINNDKLRVKRSIELLTPSAIVTDGVTTFGASSRVKLEVTPAPGATEEQIALQIKTLLAYATDTQGVAVLSGERLI